MNIPPTPSKQTPSKFIVPKDLKSFNNSPLNQNYSHTNSEYKNSLIFSSLNSHQFENTSDIFSDSSEQDEPILLNFMPFYLSPNPNFFLENISIKSEANYLIDAFFIKDVIGKGSFAEVLHVADKYGNEFAIKKSLRPYLGAEDRYHFDF